MSYRREVTDVCAPVPQKFCLMLPGACFPGRLHLQNHVRLLVDGSSGPDDFRSCLGIQFIRVAGCQTGFRFDENLMLFAYK